MSMLRLALSLLVVTCSIVLPTVATADPVKPETIDSNSQDDAWREQFRRARGLMIAGNFSEAAQAFAALTTNAVSPADKALAAELGRICLHWQQGGYQLQLGRDYKNNTQTLDGKRSTGEIASLYTTSILYGLGSGVTLAVFVEPDTAAGAILPTLLLTGASAGVVHLLDRNTKMNAGVPSSIANGLTIGFTHGMAWTLWNQARVDSEDEWSARTVAALLWGGATVGALAGGLIGTKYGTSPGRASMMGSSSLWAGAIFGLGVAVLPSDEGEEDDAAMLAAAVGLSSGAALGYFVGQRYQPSVARVRFLDLGGIVGGLLFSGLYFSAADSDIDAQSLSIATALGIASGIGITWRLTSDMATEAEGADSTWTTRFSPTTVGKGAILSTQGIF